MKQVQYMVGLVALVCLIGCATFETNTGKTISSVATTVEAARKAWVAYVTEQRVLQPNAALRQDLEKKVAKVGDAYGKYQAAMRTANATLTAYHNAPADQSTVKTALAAVSASAGELVGLINSLINQ